MSQCDAKAWLTMMPPRKKALRRVTNDEDGHGYLTMFDECRRRIANRSPAEHNVCIHLDAPRIEVICTDSPDEQLPVACGVGEIGITGAAAAMANAVFNATGKHIRDLPITLDKPM
jgi:CO/xanthine dehydrogenase Mo-binding subunit